MPKPELWELKKNTPQRFHTVFIGAIVLCIAIVIGLKYIGARITFDVLMALGGILILAIRFGAGRLILTEAGVQKESAFRKRWVVFNIIFVGATFLAMMW